MIDHLLDVTDIYTHESCPDGIASAMICRSAFNWIGKSPNIHTIQYSTERMRTLQPQPNQLFVDISPPQDRWEEWKQMNPIVLDHHESVRHIIEGLDGIFGDSNESGASLAFKYIMAPIYEEWDNNITRRLEMDDFLEWGTFAQLAMIRDTWKKDFHKWPDAAALAHALLFYGIRHMLDQKSLDLAELMRIGRIVYASTCRRADKLADGASVSSVLFRGKKIQIGTFNCTDKTMSDAANVLIDRGCNLVAGYFFLCESNTHQCCVSLRSDGSINVADIAKIRGGGGHARAAGFSVQEGGNMSPERVLACVINSLSNLQLP